MRMQRQPTRQATTVSNTGDRAAPVTVYHLALAQSSKWKGAIFRVNITMLPSSTAFLTFASGSVDPLNGQYSDGSQTYLGFVFTAMRRRGGRSLLFAETIDWLPFAVWT
tara:strand:- start:1817 stop:2143 length:327 start_codon:yes stop_codon:yes gene_type:complete